MSHTDEPRGLEYWGKIFQGNSPCGEDLSLDPKFEALQNEIQKDASIHDGQKTDWVVVYELADSILARSKDLWAYAYGSVAAYNSKNSDACASAVTSLAGLIETHWPDLYPSLKRPQRRVAPLKWLCNKFTHIAESTAFLGVPPASLTALNEAFATLQKVIDSHLPENALTFGTILREQMASTHLAAEQPMANAPQEAPKTAPTGKKGKTPPLNTTLDEIEKSSIIPSAVLPQVIRAANDYCRQLGDHLLAVNNVHEPGFLLHRVSLWYTLPQLPPADTDGLTQMICPVAPDMIDMFTAAVNDKRYAEILPQLEKAASKAPFWLDGQHLVVRCLEGMSAPDAAYSVKHVLAQLVRRFPEITFLKFKDSRPFASPKTVAWIESFAPAMFGDSPFSATSLTGSVSSTQEDEIKLLQDALVMKDEAGFEAGLACLGKAHPGRSRAFIRHCILRARYCIAVGHTQTAATLLQTIFDKLKEWDLLDWEPELTTEAVSLLMSLKTKQQKQDNELSAVLHMVSLEAAILSTKAKSL